MITDEPHIITSCHTSMLRSSVLAVHAECNFRALLVLSREGEGGPAYEDARVLRVIGRVSLSSLIHDQEQRGNPEPRHAAPCSGLSPLGLARAGS